MHVLPRLRWEEKSPRMAFLSNKTEQAFSSLEELKARYAHVPLQEANVIVALGGDGLMLRSLHQFMNRRIPIYGMNRGSVGFLMNEFRAEALLERLRHAELAQIHPLVMQATDLYGKTHHAKAINEVSLLRQTHQAAKIQIFVDGRLRLEELICDGILVATPAGSTAYNLSAHGPILPLNAPLLAVTPISPFRPRRWRGALLPNHSTICLTLQDPEGRPVSATADHIEIRNVQSVQIRNDFNSIGMILFDQGHSWEERILREMFFY